MWRSVIDWNKNNFLLHFLFNSLFNSFWFVYLPFTPLFPLYYHFVWMRSRLLVLTSSLKNMWNMWTKSDIPEINLLSVLPFISFLIWVYFLLFSSFLFMFIPSFLSFHFTPDPSWLSVIVPFFTSSFTFPPYLLLNFLSSSLQPYKYCINDWKLEQQTDKSGAGRKVLSTPCVSSSSEHSTLGIKDFPFVFSVYFLFASFFLSPSCL